MELGPGQELGCYELVELLAQDDLKESWLARDRRSSSDVVLELWQADRGPIGAAREAQILGCLQHERLVHLLDHGVVADHPYVALAHIPGQSLRERLHGAARGCLGLETALSLVADVLDALEHVHSRGFVHRDVKPETIWVGLDGRATLGGFAIAMAMADSDDPAAAVAGTPAYMAPEQWGGCSALGPQTDLYAVGVLLFELLTGALPFQAESLTELLQQHLAAPAPALRERVRELPERLEQVWRTLLAKKREDRFDSAWLAKQALFEACAAYEPTAGPHAVAAAMRKLAQADSGSTLHSAPTAQSTPEHARAELRTAAPGAHPPPFGHTWALSPPASPPLAPTFPPPAPLPSAAPLGRGLGQPAASGSGSAEPRTGSPPAAAAPLSARAGSPPVAVAPLSGRASSPHPIAAPPLAPTLPPPSRRTMPPEPSAPLAAAAAEVELPDHGSTESDARRGARPDNLARLLRQHLSPADLELMRRGTASPLAMAHPRAASTQDEPWLEELCYTADLRELLREHCTEAALSGMARTLGLQLDAARARDEHITAVLGALGFHAGPAPLRGLGSLWTEIDGHLLALSQSVFAAECLALVRAALGAVELAVDLWILLYAELLEDRAAGACARLAPLGRTSPGPALAPKLAALRKLCLEPAAAARSLGPRYGLEWPLLSERLFERLGALSSEQARAAAPGSSEPIEPTERRSERTVATALEAATQLAESPFAPELVQVVGRHDDAYGRSLYVVRDEQQARVRVLSPLELRAGGQYLTQPLRRPVALAPALVSYDPRLR